MINKLIVLADKLDNANFKDAANFVDNLVKQAREEEEEWVDEPTKVDRSPMPSSLPPLDPGVLEDSPVMSSMEIARDLRSIFASLPNPDTWSAEIKGRVSLLMDRLREVL